MRPIQSLAVLALTLMMMTDSVVLPPFNHSSLDRSDGHVWMSSGDENFTRSGSQPLVENNNSTTYAFPLGDIPSCPLSTCVLIQLGERLQQGDQVAGSSTKDPLSPGKK